MVIVVAIVIGVAMAIRPVIYSPPPCVREMH